MLSGGEFDAGAPHLVQRVDGGTYHPRQILDWLEFTHRDGRQRLPHRIAQRIRIDRAEEPTGEPRRQLSHGHDLHAVFAGARRGDTGHVPGKFCVDDDGSALARAAFIAFPPRPQSAPTFQRERRFLSDGAKFDVIIASVQSHEKPDTVPCGLLFQQPDAIASKIIPSIPTGLARRSINR